MKRAAINSRRNCLSGVRNYWFSYDLYRTKRQYFEPSIYCLGLHADKLKKKTPFTGLYWRSGSNRTPMFLRMSSFLGTYKAWFTPRLLFIRGVIQIVRKTPVPLSYGSPPWVILAIAQTVSDRVQEKPTIAFFYRPPTEEDVRKWRVQTRIFFIFLRQRKCQVPILVCRKLRIRNAFWSLCRSI